MTTTVVNTMTNNEYWNKISCSPSAYFDEFPLNLINDVLAAEIDCINPFDAIIKEENEEISPSSSSDEIDHQPIQASSTNSPPTESQVLDLICGVCGAPAHGYNFDQITCESCKAFFRRNALRNMSNLRCRFSGNCIINVYTRRQCTYCRLKKCFDIKMRKDWIRTEEERELRRLKNLHKQQRKFNKLSVTEQQIINLPIVIRKKKRILQSFVKPIKQEHVIDKVEPISRIHMFGMHRNLSNHDRILFSNIENAYKIGADQADCSHICQYTSKASLAQFLNDETVNHRSLIFFYKQILEFKQFDINDQILLIKSNMIGVIHLHHIIVQNFQEIRQIGTHMSNWISPDFHQQMSNTRQKFDCFMKYPMVIKLTMIVFIFSMNLSLPRGSTQFMDYSNREKLIKNQNFYVSVLWRYLNYLFGEKQAIQSIQLIVMQILRYQTLMNKMDEVLRKNKWHENIFDPLMQSIFGLT